MTVDEVTPAIRKFTNDVLKVNVKKGAEFLDEHWPGWAGAINVRKLNLSAGTPTNGTGCVLCQLDNYLSEDGERLPKEKLSVDEFGSYNDAVGIIQYEVDGDFDGTEYGFDLSNRYYYEFPLPGLTAAKEYAILDELWEAEIEERVSNGSTV